MKHTAFINNPELRRNTWLELSPGRLVAMPIILTAVFLLVYLNARNDMYASVSEDLREWSIIMFGLIVLLWGSKQASEAVIGEVNDNTWDCQRLTLISPWVMSIGKLFGSTMYNWYGGGLCLLVYLWSSFQLPDLDQSLKGGLMLVLESILLHTVVISMTLLGINKNRNLGKIKSTFYFLLSLIIGGYMYSVATTILDGGDQGMQWYWWSFQFSDFALISMFVFTGWGIFGLYRNMRTELQYRNGPWVWYAFLFFLIIYSIGFINSDQLSPNEMKSIDSIRYYIAFIILISITYYMVFSESKYIVNYRQIISYVKDARYKDLLHIAPLWLLTVLLLVPLSILGVGLGVLDPNFSFEGDISIIFPLTLLCFVIRDIGFLIFMNLAEKAKRADFATIVYLLLLYTLIPAILVAASLSNVNLMFIPDPEGGIIGFCAVLSQVILIIFLLSKRYKLRNKLIEKRGVPVSTDSSEEVQP